MKKLQSFVAFFTIVSFIIFPTGSVFALGEDLTPLPILPVEITPPQVVIPSPETISPIIPETIDTIIAPVISDTTAPVISNVASLSLGITESTIVWDTNELAVSALEYGTTTNYGSHATLPLSGLLVHSAILTGLTAATTYYYCIHATDLSNNMRNSCSSFTTAANQVVTDSTSPNIVSVAVAPVTTTSATVSFATDEVANAQVEYGTTEGYGMTTTFDPNLSLSHTVQLSNLTPNTEYHYRIITSDQLGNETISFDETFTTHPTVTTPITTMAIQNIETAGLTTTSVTFSWTTTLPSDSQIEYGDSENFGHSTVLSSSLTTEHVVTIGGLAPGTNYFFRVKSKPTGTMIATVSSNHEFNTLGISVPVVPPANIISVSSGTPTSTSASIIWNTDKIATSQVEYGINTSYGQSSIENQSMQTSHTVALSELAPSTTYHYRVKSVDEVGNSTYSEDYTFSTTTRVQSAPSAITAVSIGGYDESSINLVWHASSANADTAAQYEIRYSTSPITSLNWAQATLAQSTPIYYSDISPAGTERSYIVAGLSHATTYYFAIVSKFQNTGWSDISNVVYATTTQNTSVNNETTVSSNSGIIFGYGGGSSGAASGSYEPTVIKATPADNEIIFSWHNPGEINFVRTIIIRNENEYPASPKDGTIVYEGRSETFTDTNVQNGKTYYYAVYSYNHNKTYSAGIKISATPTNTNKEVKLNKSGVIVQATAIEHFTRVWKKGNTDIEIEHLQEVLAADDNSYSQKYITGYFGLLTETALKNFQKKRGLKVTGVVDTETQLQLNIASRSQGRLSIPGEYAIFEKDLKQGNENKLVRALQHYLVYEGSLSPDSVNGYYGPQTKAAVIAFQKKYGIVPPIGYTGYKTRHKMRELAGL